MSTVKHAYETQQEVSNGNLVAKLGMQKELPKRSTLSEWFLPHQETQMVVSQASKGLFIPWPLLAIVVSLAVILVSGIISLQVQISNLSTTLLLRDADHARQVDDLKTVQTEIKAKNEQLMVYIQNDREKLVSIQTRLGIKQ